MSELITAAEATGSVPWMRVCPSSSATASWTEALRPFFASPSGMISEVRPAFGSEACRPPWGPGVGTRPAASSSRIQANFSVVRSS